MHSLHKAQLLLQRLPTLSSPPATIFRSIELALDEQPSLKDMVALARTDPGLSASILRRRPAGEPNRKGLLHIPNAALELGVAQLRESALRAEIRGQLELFDAPAGAVCSTSSRKHAVACAAAAHELAQRTGYPEPEVAYAAGLLSSIGSLALWELFEREIEALRARVVGKDVHHLLQVERDVLGFDHENLAVVMCDAWSLPFELRDVLTMLYRSSDQVAKVATASTDVQLVGLVRAAWHAAHEAGFPLLSTLRAGERPADVANLLAAIDEIQLLEHVRQSVGAAAELTRPRAQRLDQAFATMRAANAELKQRLIATERRLRAEESVNGVLQYGLQRLGDGDPLPGVMYHAMESIGFRRIACLEIDEPASKLEVMHSSSTSGSSRVPEKAWIPFPTDKAYLGTPQIISRDDRNPAHQLVLELIGVSSAVIAPLQSAVTGRRMVLCADRGPAGHAPITGEDRALGIIADQASLLMKFEQLTREKERMATQDPLTGAATRRRMMERIDFLMTQTLRTRMPFSLIIMDLDHFKKFNDTMGHQTGDKLLQDLVKLLQTNVRKGDLVARYGGEEFVVLLPNCDIEQACSVGEDLRRKVFAYGEASVEDYKGLQVSVSMGAAQWSATETALGLIGRADAALYEAKHTGRNRVLRAA